jgi:hypothetical protein
MRCLAVLVSRREPMSTAICYLCSQPITSTSEVSDDHRVPRSLLRGAVPKRHGFAYAGQAPTHPNCNHHFRGENFVATALRLLGKVKSGKALMVLRHPEDPSIEVQILVEDELEAFRRRDLDYFHLIDRREVDGAGTLPSVDFFKGHQRTNLEREATFVMLSVVAKSAASLLLAQCHMPLPARWHIQTAAWYGTPFGSVAARLSQGIRFHEKVQVWIGQHEGACCALYFAHQVLVGLQFGASDRRDWLDELSAELGQTDRLLFEGATLLELIDYRWPYAPARRSPDDPLAVRRPRNVLCACGSERRYKHCHGRLGLGQP